MNATMSHPVTLNETATSIRMPVAETFPPVMLPPEMVAAFDRFERCLDRMVESLGMVEACTVRLNRIARFRERVAARRIAR